MALWKKVFIGMIVGIIVGLIARYTNPSFVDYVKPIGDIFINLLKMLVVPILLFSIISGITSVQDSKTLGRVGTKSAIAYIATALIAVSSGMIIANIIQPGAESDFHYLLEREYVKLDKYDHNTELRIIEMLVSFVPKNIFESFATGNTLQVVFFAFFAGIVLNMMGDEGRKLIEGCNMMAKIVFRMVSIIIKLSPYGAGSLIAWLVGKYGIDEMLSLFNLVVTVFVGMGVEYIMIGIYIMVFARLSPLPFYRKSVEYQAVALSTTSSKASLPITMQVCRNKLGVSHICSSFVLPLGASVNMAATS
ncbi:MAG: dicarboxylate/amino acid:cation symporter, partial [Pseudomonadota bacterium]